MNEYFHSIDSRQLLASLFDFLKEHEPITAIKKFVKQVRLKNDPCNYQKIETISSGGIGSVAEVSYHNLGKLHSLFANYSNLGADIKLLIRPVILKMQESSKFSANIRMKKNIQLDIPFVELLANCLINGFTNTGNFPFSPHYYTLSICSFNPIKTYSIQDQLSFTLTDLLTEYSKNVTRIDWLKILIEHCLIHYTLYNLIGIKHLDTHSDNFMFINYGRDDLPGKQKLYICGKDLNEVDHFRYTIMNKGKTITFILPNNGIISQIIDWGQCSIDLSRNMLDIKVKALITPYAERLSNYLFQYSLSEKNLYDEIQPLAYTWYNLLHAAKYSTFELNKRRKAVKREEMTTFLTDLNLQLFGLKPLKLKDLSESNQFLNWVNLYSRILPRKEIYESKLNDNRISWVIRRKNFITKVDKWSDFWPILLKYLDDQGIKRKKEGKQVVYLLTEDKGEPMDFDYSDVGKYGYKDYCSKTNFINAHLDATPRDYEEFNPLNYLNLGINWPIVKRWDKNYLFSDTFLYYQDKSIRLYCWKLQPESISYGVIHDVEKFEYKVNNRNTGYVKYGIDYLNKPLQLVSINVFYLDKGRLYYNKGKNSVFQNQLKYPNGVSFNTSYYYSKLHNSELLKISKKRGPIGYYFVNGEHKLEVPVLPALRQYYGIVLHSEGEIKIISYKEFVKKLAKKDYTFKYRGVKGIIQDKNEIIDVTKMKEVDYDLAYAAGPLLVKDGMIALDYETIMTKEYKYKGKIYYPWSNDLVIKDNRIFSDQDGGRNGIWGMKHSDQFNNLEALCIDKKGKAFIVQVEGRNFGGIGLDRAQLAEVCLSLGAVTAVSHDGGFSNQMAFTKDVKQTLNVSYLPNYRESEMCLTWSYQDPGMIIGAKQPSV